MRYEDENIWLTQKMMAELYGVDIRTIDHHIKQELYDQDTPRRSDRLAIRWVAAIIIVLVMIFAIFFLK